MKYSGVNKLEFFLEFLKENSHNMKPCSPKDIAQLKQLANNRLLPKTYLLFMESAGHGIRFFRGSSYNINEISLLQEGAVELLQEDRSAETLTNNDFVFFMHQGYQFYFFKLDEGENPPVYFYEEGKNLKKFVKKHHSLTEFFIENYNGVEHLIKD